MLFLRRYRVVRVVFLCLLALSSCEQAYEDEGVTGGGEEPVPLQLAGLFIKESGVSSRSGGVQPLTAGDIGIFRYAGEGYSEIRSNVHYRYSDGTWSVPDAGGPIYLTKKPANLCAYYPYSSADDYADGVVTLTSQRYAQSADLCYQTGVTASSTSGPMGFTLNRAYAKWVFNFTRDASYTGTCAVSQIKMVHPDLVSSNTLNLITGEYGTPASGSKGSVTITDVGISGIASGGTQTVSVLMVPVLPDAPLSGDITLTFTVDGKEMATTVNALGAVLTANNQYVLNVTIKDSTPTVTLTANSYMISPGHSLKIPVNIKGNGGDVAGTGLSTTHTAASVGILWQTSPGLISLSDFSSSAQTVKITASSSNGNAVIAAYDGPNATGNILWSWHIWVTDYNPDSYPVANGNVYTYNNYIWMDRNLGATTVTPANVNTLGLYYQWGRKDPFPGPSDYKDIMGSYSSLPIYNASGVLLTEGTPTGGTGINSVTVSVINNLINSIRNPMIFYCCPNSNELQTTQDWYTNSNDHTYQNDALWGGGDPIAGVSGNKTIFDPCPPGWRVPAWRNNTSPWNGFTVDTFPWSNYGRIYTAANTYYPAAGYRYSTTGALTYVGKVGNYWSASVSSTIEDSYLIHFTIDILNPSSINYRAPAYSIRCVRE